MRMLEYIAEIQRQLIEVYGFPKGDNGCPRSVVDGEYPMKIDGKTDYVRIVQGSISCCNWREEGQS